MPRTRTLLRVVNRDAQRRFARPGQPLTGKAMNRADRRRYGQRHGDVAAIVHDRHPMTVRPAGPTSGQARINAKREARAQYWAGFAAQSEAV